MKSVLIATCVPNTSGYLTTLFSVTKSAMRSVWSIAWNGYNSPRKEKTKMGYCKPYPSPCERCTKEHCREKYCEDWKIRYLYRQKQINDYAKKLGLVIGEERATDGTAPV